MIEIAAGVHIREEELLFQASRSSGPGGQNVNKLNTRMSVLFDVNACSSLTAEQKVLVLRRLARRLTSDGLVRVTCQEHRSQAANRQAAVDRLAELLRQALARRPVRKATAVPRSAKLKRLQDKARHSRLKKMRAADGYDQ